jgi:TetR/AcrR family transcriptional regulator, fatty acid metabolism regulator protein
MLPQGVRPRQFGQGVGEEGAPALDRGPRPAHTESRFSRDMPRRRTDDKRQRILQAAVKVFARKGYHGAKVSEIARRADVADGTIYLYFRNKEDILVSLFDQVMVEHLARAREELAAVEGAPARLRALAGHHLRVLGGNRDLAVVFQVELRQSTKFMERFTASWLQDYFALLDEVLAEGQREGSLRFDLPRKVAGKAFFGALDEMVTSWIVGGKDYDLPRRADTVVDLFLRGASASRKAASRPALTALAAARGGR